MGKKTKRSIKVLHAPLDFANQAYVLSQALRDRGIDSHLLRYQWEANCAVRDHATDDRVAEISNEDWFGDLLRNLQNVSSERFDIVHFWHRTLVWRRPDDVFNGIDLPFIRSTGARVAYRFKGYELRKKSRELEVNPFTPYRYGYVSPFTEDDQQRYLDYLGSYVDAFIVQDPEMQAYCPKARIMPCAVDLARFALPEPAPNPRPLVVHAPGSQKLKGTEFVVTAVQSLKEEGLDFDFRLIENMPSAEALALYRRADIVIDQLLLGWYGVVAIEAMAMGKTVIAYIRDDLQGHFRNAMPLVNANPETLTKVLRDVIKDRELRRDIAGRARAFVEATHDSRLVARTAVKTYRKMLKAPTSRMVPDLSYQIGNSANFTKLLSDGAQAKNWAQKISALENDYDALKAVAAAAKTEAARLIDEAAVLRGKAERFDQVEQELPALRHDARRYEALKTELPALRYKAKRYDEIKDSALEWRAKADRLDRFAATRRVRLVLRLLGLSLTIKSPRAPRTAGDKTQPASRGRSPAATTRLVMLTAAVRRFCG